MIEAFPRPSWSEQNDRSVFSVTSVANHYPSLYSVNSVTIIKKAVGRRYVRPITRPSAECRLSTRDAPTSGKRLPGPAAGSCPAPFAGTAAVGRRFAGAVSTHCKAPAHAAAVDAALSPAILPPAAAGFQTVRFKDQHQTAADRANAHLPQALGAGRLAPTGSGRESNP